MFMSMVHHPPWIRWQTVLSLTGKSSAPSQYKDRLSRSGDFHYKDKTVVRLAFPYNGNPYTDIKTSLSRWRHQMETFSTLLVICAGISPLTCEFPAHRPVTASFDVFFDLRLYKRLSKQSWGWWFDTLSRPLWRHCNVVRRPTVSLFHWHSTHKQKMKHALKDRHLLFKMNKSFIAAILSSVNYRYFNK